MKFSREDFREVSSEKLPTKTLRKNFKTSEKLSSERKEAFGEKSNSQLSVTSISSTSNVIGRRTRAFYCACLPCLCSANMHMHRSLFKNYCEFFCRAVQTGRRSGHGGGEIVNVWLRIAERGSERPVPQRELSGPTSSIERMRVVVLHARKWQREVCVATYFGSSGSRAG